ncbi:MAG: hypothetical protein QM500_17805 [Methylococcales bacterium]
MLEKIFVYFIILFLVGAAVYGLDLHLEDYPQSIEEALSYDKTDKPMLCNQIFSHRSKNPVYKGIVTASSLLKHEITNQYSFKQCRKNLDTYRASLCQGFVSTITNSIEQIYNQFPNKKLMDWGQPTKKIEFFCQYEYIDLLVSQSSSITPIVKDGRTLFKVMPMGEIFFPSNMVVISPVKQWPVKGVFLVYISLANNNNYYLLFKDRKKADEVFNLLIAES